jgi:hypothetical protein
VIIFPLRSPVRRAQQVKNKTSDVHSAIAKEIEDGDQRSDLIDTTEADGHSNQTSSKVHRLFHIAFEEVKDLRQHVIIRNSINKIRSVLYLLKG